MFRPLVVDTFHIDNFKFIVPNQILVQINREFPYPGNGMPHALLEDVARSAKINGIAHKVIHFIASHKKQRQNHCNQTM